MADGEVERLLEEFAVALVAVEPQVSAHSRLSAHASLFTPLCSHRQRTVDVWMRAPALDPTKVLPALMRYDLSLGAGPPPPAHHGIRYLRHCVETQGCTQPVRRTDRT